MRRALRIADKLSLPIEAVTQTLVVYGGKGMGKTNFGRVLVEELARNNLRFSLIDPVGVSWGLRHSADGSGPGIENVLVLGGVHGDIPIQPSAGAVVADLVADENVNTLIDISRWPDGRLWSVGEKIRFVTDYALRLYMRQGEKREPIMVILDEAARYIPQVIPAGNLDLAKCVGAWEMLTEEGRNVGIGVTFLTQRSARMNKSVSELADAMIAFRTVGPRSIDAILDWFGEHVPKERWKEYIEQLRKLPVGEALVVSPGWLQYEGSVHIRLAETFDSSSTPKPGESRRSPRGKGAGVDKAKYEQRMQAAIAEADANDPAKLRARITELTKELAEDTRQHAIAAARQPERVVETKIERVEVPILTDTDRAVFDDIAKALRTISGLADRIGEIDARIARLGQNAPQARPAAPAVRSIPVRTPAPPPAPAHSGAQQAVFRHVDPQDADTTIRAGARKMLDVLARHHPLRYTRAQWGTLSGMKHTGGTFGAYLSLLKRLGYVELQGDLFGVTDAGLAYAGVTPGAPMSTEEVLDQWRAKLRAGARKMFDVLVESYPRALSRAELAEQVGMEMTGGTFGAYVGTLRRNGLAIDDSGAIRASDLAMGVHA